MYTILYYTVLTFEGLQALKLTQVPNPYTAVRRPSSDKITVFTERKVRNLTGGVIQRERIKVRIMMNFLSYIHIHYIL